MPSETPESGERRGRLSIVATPIGNLSDLTERARQTFQEVDLVAAEDTRRTRTLLNHLGCGHTRIVRLDENATERDIEVVVLALLRGEHVAFASDAGTPVISDPGAKLVQAARARGIEIVPIPGVSAVTAALSVAGFGGGPFSFLGFLGRKGQDKTQDLSRIVESEDVIVFFEAPHRIDATLEALARLMPAREALVARELTKMYEELIAGTLEEVRERTRGREWLGEITVVLGPYAAKDHVATIDIDERIDTLVAEGRHPKDIAAIVAMEASLPNREAYAKVLARRRITSR